MLNLNRSLICLTVVSLALAACGRDPAEDRPATARIISLDFCADQYLLAFADRDAVAGLSPDATKSFSYFRDAVKGLPVVRPRAEDILVHRPDAVIRTYGGGPAMTAFLERAGVTVIQIPYAGDLSAIAQTARSVAAALGDAEGGDKAARAMGQRLDALAPADGTVLYLTSKGAVAGADTLIDELIERSGRRNFQTRPGWGTAPLERLAYETPDIIAAGFFDGPDARTDRWSPAHHPVARRAMAEAHIIDMPGAWTACSAWFIADAAEALAAP